MWVIHGAHHVRQRKIIGVYLWRELSHTGTCCEEVCYLHEVFMPVGFAMKMGVLVVTTGVKTEVSPCCETALSSGACLAEMLLKDKLPMLIHSAHSHTTAPTTLHCMQSVRPSPQSELYLHKNLLCFWQSPIYHQLPETLV